MFVILILLILFMVFIKLTALAFCILPVILFIKNRKDYRIGSSVIIITSLTIASILVKNIIITGNALFPFIRWNSFKTSWHLPERIESYFAIFGKANGYHLSAENFETASFVLRFENWLLAPNIHGLFNLLIVGLLIVMPLLIKKFYNHMAYWILYGFACINMVLFFITSPQYRFFFPFIMLFGLMVIALIIKHSKTLNIILVASTLFAAIPLVFSVNNEEITNNKNHTVSSQFQFDYILKPHANSKFPSDYKPITVGNTILNTPTNVTFFWATGDVPIPAINQEQLEYFKTYFNVIPQQNSEDLKDGFYSDFIKNE